VSDARPDHLTWRHRLVGLLVLGAIGLIVFRLYELQVVDHEQYLAQAIQTRYGNTEVPASRGVITDATGYPLAASVDTWDIYIDRFRWRDRDRASLAAIELGAFLELDANQLMADGTSTQNGDIIVRRDIGYEDGLALLELDLWGVRTLPSAVRTYPEGDLARQIVGHVGIDGVGLWGVEADFDHLLRGQAGSFSRELDLLGRPIAFSDSTDDRAIRGGEVQLTIDRFIQTIIEEELDRALEEFDARSGSILVMDPRTGAILGMASRPSTGITTEALNNPALPELVRNRPMTDLYEPGSVFKTLTTAVAIDLGLVTPESTYIDEGSVVVGPNVINNWDFTAYGEVTVRTYLQKSLNTGAVWLSDEIGAENFYQYLDAFGIGEPTHVGLSGEAEGLVRHPSDPEWYPVDLATNSYGQGLAASPLQVLTAVNVFANDGWLMRPYIVSRVVSEDDVRTFDPVAVRQVVSSSTASTMAALMRDVVDGVQWHLAQVDGYTVAGKTGTTIVSIPTGYDFDTTIASFAGFLPYAHPEVSILVKIDQPNGDLKLGGQVAAPVFARVASAIMEYRRVLPHDALVSSP
jgi:cell division protein FtsI/penicillin-binding protein 2